MPPTTDFVHSSIHPFEDQLSGTIDSYGNYRSCPSTVGWTEKNIILIKYIGTQQGTHTLYLLFFVPIYYRSHFGISRILLPTHPHSVPCPLLIHFDFNGDGISK